VSFVVLLIYDKVEKRARGKSRTQQQQELPANTHIFSMIPSNSQEPFRKIKSGEDT
jgi:hypothetical protein